MTFTLSCTTEEDLQCQKYLDCDSYYRALFDIDDSNREKLEESFGQGGTCWTNEKYASECVSRCENAHTALKRAIEIADKDLGKCVD